MFAFAQFAERMILPSSALTVAVSIHHCGLLLLFASSFRHVSHLCPNQLQCLHLILSHWGQSLALCPPFRQRLQSNLNAVTDAITSSWLSLSLNFAQSFLISFHAKPLDPSAVFAFLFTMNWHSSGFYLSNGIVSFTGIISLNPGFNTGLTPLSAQTAVAFVNQTAKCFLSPSKFGICLKLVESMVQSCFAFLLLSFLLSLASTDTKHPEVTHRLSNFEVHWKPSKLATPELELGKWLLHNHTFRKVSFCSYF